jgi:hypothetical protein
MIRFSISQWNSDLWLYQLYCAAMVTAVTARSGRSVVKYNFVSVAEHGLLIAPAGVHAPQANEQKLASRSNPESTLPGPSIRSHKAGRPLFRRPVRRGKYETRTDNCCSERGDLRGNSSCKLGYPQFRASLAYMDFNSKDDRIRWDRCLRHHSSIDELSMRDWQ